MRAYRIAPGAGIDGLVLSDEPEPSPGHGEVVVAVRAVSLNYRDLVMVTRAGVQSVVATSDGAGEIVAVGEGVEGWRVGDRVSANFFPRWLDGPFRARYHRHALGGTVDGMLAERVALAADALVRLPDGLSFEAAATLPCAALTAWNALFCQRQTRPGETVLVLGSGGVSVFALQLARAAGARVIATTSSADKAARLSALGADAVVNYTTSPDWDKEVLALTGGEGVDVVVEVGGAGTLAQSLNAAATGGMVSLIGVLTGTSGAVNPWPMVGKALHVVGIYVGSRTMFEDLLAAVAANGLEPVIDRTVPFDDAPDAYRHLQAQRHIGKVVIAW